MNFTGVGIEPFIVLIFILVALALIIGNAVLLGRRRDNLDRATRKFNGRTARGWFAGSDCDMEVDGVPARLSHHPGSKHRSPYTRLRFRIPVGGRLRVVPEGVFGFLKKAFWSEDLRIGDAAFDAAFIIQGHPGDWIRRVLDPTARQRLHRLAALGTGLLRGPSVTLEAGPAGVLLALPRDITAELPALEAFLDDAVELFRALRNPPEEGVKFVSAEEVVAKGSCPVCEHPLDGRPRRCGACATPHHAECWSYFGGCSTYACKENP